jgi:hypothetical protein
MRLLHAQPPIAIIYRDLDGKLDWQRTMARDWATRNDKVITARGRWIRLSSGSGSVVCLGWGDVYARFTTEILDFYARTILAHTTFHELVTRPRWFPSLTTNAGPHSWRRTALADAYDTAQFQRRDPRRAIRGMKCRTTRGMK